ncbi:MAG: polysulfide reductase NrfD [Caldilineales bacterium]|nr:polysulfide reductase NrfD [Caldilineales bacterium]
MPLGVYRTWVKYVETGVYPDARRHFQVTRCNHCANPPCVRICPVTAMYQRDDGIVEFDPSICIGCKACMQACPYDAIYIDPESGTAAKCHFCSHRTEIGLEPACVVVCPEHAIIAGDLDDPMSEISRLIAVQDVTVRKPEQGTAPKLFYIDGNDVVMHPTATERTPESFLWADVIPLHAKNGNHSSDLVIAHPGGNGHEQTQAVYARSGAAIRTPQAQGAPANGPIQFGGRMAEHMVQTSYNAQHKIPWHWPVPAYLVTKGIGSGLFMMLALGLGLNLFRLDALANVVLGFLSLAFIGITTFLLVYDLDRPERFFSILLRPQWKSWLTRGAFILVGFTVVAGIWWLLELGIYVGAVDASLRAIMNPVLLSAGFVLAVGAAIYTAFLFGQAEGRDLWQSPMLPLHLIIQALMAGSAAMLIVTLFIELPASAEMAAGIVFAAMLVLDLFVTLAGEYGMPHASEVAARAAHEISHGHYRGHYWTGSILIGHIVPLVLLLAIAFTGMTIWGAAAAIAAIIGLYFYEYAFVMAPQEVPNS